jgi:hypothetical protein
MTADQGFTHEDVVRWVKESCAAQGVPLKINDQQAMNSIAALLMSERRPD